MAARAHDPDLEIRIFGDPHHNHHQPTPSPGSLESPVPDGEKDLSAYFSPSPLRAADRTRTSDSTPELVFGTPEAPETQAAPVQLVLPYQPGMVLVNGQHYLPFTPPEEQEAHSPFGTISADQPDYLTQMLQGVFRARREAQSRNGFYRAIAEQLLRDTGAMYLVLDVSHWPVSYPAGSVLSLTTMFEKGRGDDAEAFFKSARADNHFIVREGDQTDRILPYTGQELSVLQLVPHNAYREKGGNLRQYKHIFSYKPNGKTYMIGSIGIHGIPASSTIESHTLNTILLAVDTFLHEDLQMGRR
ncbi:hypothetical protein HYS47_05525 [Candidatus Woesearchaeota archaeon]|nr:hypothetical protein [Candidatus Woesearchaeota archaeon]